MVEESTLIKLAKVLTTTGRERVASKNFVFPKEKRYPIHDLPHARNALTRISTFGTPEEKAKVRSAVYRKYPGLRERAKERGTLKKTSADIYNNIYETAFANELEKIGIKTGQKVKPSALKGGPAEPTAKAPAGKGPRFKALAGKLERQPGVYDPKGLAAAIGRAKFGKKKFQQMAAAGKK